jgi:TonB family protein
MKGVVTNTALFQSDWVGRVIDGKFPLLEWLGSSESDAVFRTELQGSQPQRAAIRLVAATTEDAQARLDSWRAAAALSHPRLMRILHSGRSNFGADEVFYVVTEFAEEALSQVLPERPLTPAEVKEMLEPVIDALGYVHGKGLAYGSLKPSKIMVVDDQMKLPADSLHRVGKLGRPPAKSQIYEAPEIATGAISAASDVWSLGVSLVEALTQHPPLWDRSYNSDPVVPASVPQPFADIARKCLRREPESRGTLAEILAILDLSRPVPVAAVKTDPVRSAPIAPPSIRVDRNRSRSRVAILIGGVFVLFVVVAVLLLHKTQPSSPSEKNSASPDVSSVPTPAPMPAPVAPIQASKGATAKAEVAQRVMPDISDGANRTIHGKFEVKVRISVDAKGDVSDASFDAPGPSKYFANQAMQAARNWKFNPAQADGKPVASEWILRFEFRRDKTDCTPVEVSR